MLGTDRAQVCPIQLIRVSGLQSWEEKTETTARQPDRGRDTTKPRPPGTFLFLSHFWFYYLMLLYVADQRHGTFIAFEPSYTGTGLLTLKNTISEGRFFLWYMFYSRGLSRLKGWTGDVGQDLLLEEFICALTVLSAENDRWWLMEGGGVDRIGTFMDVLPYCLVL